MDTIARYFHIWSILIKYFYRSFRAGRGSEKYLPKGMRAPQTPEDRHKLRAIFLREALQELGPTFIKIGQFLSIRGGMLPYAFMTELEKLQDNVPPFPFLEAERIIEEDVPGGMKAFKLFEREPLASASLSQVHLAITIENIPVAVKVQRPNITGIIHQDIRIFKSLAKTLTKHFAFFRPFDLKKLAKDFEQTIHDELDFRLEASNIEIIAKNMEHLDRIKLPKVYATYSSGRVLTMERIIGYRISDQVHSRLSQEDRTAVAEQLLEAYLKQILQDGFFHADPHPGNLILLPDEGKIALVDLGIVGRLDSNLRERLVKSFVSFTEQETERVLELIMESSTHEPDADIVGFEQDLVGIITRYHNRPVDQMQVGGWVVDLTRVAIMHGIHPPTSLTMLGKTMIYIDRASRLLDPTLNYLSYVERSRYQILYSQLRESMSAARISRSALDLGNLILDLPEKSYLLMRKLVDNDFRIQFEHVRLEGFIHALNQSANRLAIATILAAIIIGTSMVMRGSVVQELLKTYSNLIILGFFLAILLGLYLVYSIFRSSRRR